MLRDNITEIQSMQFKAVNMDTSFSPAALIVCLLIAAFIIVTMSQPMLRWLSMCSSEDGAGQIIELD